MGDPGVSGSSSVCAVKVYTRVRPVNEIETKLEAESSNSRDEKIELSEDGKSITSYSSTNGSHTFTFDGVLGPDSDQEKVYCTVAEDFMNDMLAGYNATIFAYGQTGAGKSFTMFGPANLTRFDDQQAGVVPRAIYDLFDKLEQAKERNGCSYKITVSYLQIYQEAVQDLLKPKNMNLRVRESPTEGVYVEGLMHAEVNTVQETLEWLQMGGMNRTFAQTACNETSSRSHTLFSLTLTEMADEGSKRQSKLCLADLAGSEKVGKSQVQGEQFVEAININTSLSSLGHCIYALTSNKKGKASHVPYRDSKLTFILKDSLGGNSKTALICAVSPHDSQFPETVNTLQFASRAKMITNSVSVKTIMSHGALVATIQRLEASLAAAKEQIASLQLELGVSPRMSEHSTPASSPTSVREAPTAPEAVDGMFGEARDGELECALEMVKAVGQQNKVLANEARAAAQLQAQADEVATAALSQNSLLKERIRELEASVQTERELAMADLEQLHMEEQNRASLALETAKEALRAKTLEVKQLKNQVEQLLDVDQARQAKITEVNATLEAKQRSYDETLSALTAVTTERDALLEEKDKLVEAKSALAAQLNKSMMAASSGDETHSQQMQELQQQLDRATEQFSEDLRRAKKEMSHHSRTKMAAAQSTIDQLESDLCKAHSERDAVTQECEAMKGEMHEKDKSADHDHAESESRITETKALLVDAEQRMQAIEAERCRTVSDLSDKMAELNEVRAQLREQNLVNANQRNELLRMRKVVSNVLEEKKQMEGILMEETDSHKTIEMLRMETKRLQESSEQAHQDAVQAHKAKDELSATLEALEQNFIRKIAVTSKSSNLSAYFPSPRSSGGKKGDKHDLTKSLAASLGIKESVRDSPYDTKNKVKSKSPESSPRSYKAKKNKGGSPRSSYKRG